eukprot:COSAG06_NODE_3137_length_5802_cov_19.787480_5_plen_502_part_00
MSEEMHRHSQEINLEMYQGLQQEMHRRLAIVEGAQNDLVEQSFGDGSTPGRLLQSAGDCLTTEEVSEAAVNAVRTAFIVKEDQVALSAALDDKADAAELDALAVTVGEKAIAADMTTALAAKADASALAEKAGVAELDALSAQFGSALVVEVTPCRCAVCADDPVGGNLCAPYGPVSPCECEDASGSSDPIRQTYPMTESNPPCCQEHWLVAATVTQATSSVPQVFDEDDITVRIHAEVTFVWTGFENLVQVGEPPENNVCTDDRAWLYVAFGVEYDCAAFVASENLGVTRCEEAWAVGENSNGESVIAYEACRVSCPESGTERTCTVPASPVSDGIQSGDPSNGGTFTHTFDTAGEYYFRSQVHDFLQAKVTVTECVSCVVVAGYDGANPATLALALSSRAAGEFALAISSAGMARVMTLLTVYDGQTLALTGEDSEVGQLPMADAKITALDGASVVVNNAFVSGGVALAQRATLEDNTGQDRLSAAQVRSVLTMGGRDL